MHKTTAPVKRAIVDVDTRRAVMSIAMGRKPRDVAEVPHEAFIRNMLKDRLGWPRREPAPDAIKEATRQMASFLIARDEKVADEKAARDAIVAQEAAEAKILCEQHDAEVAKMDLPDYVKEHA